MPGSILIVDDNRDAREMWAESLTGAGHTVTVAHSGEEALVMLPSFQPTVAVVDLGLPGISGFELAGRIRAALPAVRLLALSGYGQSTDKARAMEAGFDRHVTKPLSESTLDDLLSGLPVRNA